MTSNGEHSWPHRQIAILGTGLTAQRFDEAIAQLIASANSATPFRANFCTVHTVVEAQRNARLRQAFATADMLAMDGMPLVWLARRRGANDAERVCGPDVMLAVADRGRSSNVRHFFLGSTPETLKRLIQALERRYKGIVIAGSFAPPMGPITPPVLAEIERALKGSNANVLWVGIGSPRQEIWSAEVAGNLGVPVVLPVGAAFDFHAGRVQRAPEWMQRRGLEWLYRVIREPRRLAGRYLGTNIRFLWLVFVETVRGRQR